MTARELNAVRELNEQVVLLERRLAELRLTAQDIVPANDGMPRGNLKQSKVENLVMKILECEDELEALRNELSLARSELKEKIFREVADPVQQKLLLLRYVECLTVKETARRLRITLRHAFRLQQKFLTSYN